MDCVPIEVKDLSKSREVIATIYRAVSQHKGWESVRYKGKRYQLFGMIRTPYFIDLSNPLKRR